MYSVTSLTLSALFLKVSPNNTNKIKELVRKHKLSNFCEKYWSPHGSSDTYAPLLNILSTKDILPAWKLNFILDALEYTSIETQKEILCILSINSSPIPQ